MHILHLGPSSLSLDYLHLISGGGHLVGRWKIRVVVEHGEVGTNATIGNGQRGGESWRVLKWKAQRSTTIGSTTANIASSRAGDHELSAGCTGLTPSTRHSKGRRGAAPGGLSRHGQHWVVVYG